MPFFGTTTLQDVSDHLKSQDMLPETGLGLISSLIENKVDQQSRLTSPSVDEPSAGRRDDPARQLRQTAGPGISMRRDPEVPERTHLR